MSECRAIAAPASPVGEGGCWGKIEEYFIETLSPGETFLFAGFVLRFEGIHENEVIATRTQDTTPKIPLYAGGKFPLSTYLAAGVRSILADPGKWRNLPRQVSDWLRVQRRQSVLPRVGQLLVETFPRGTRFYLVAYPFEGRLAHQTLGMLLTRRLERAKLRPTGFVATDYSIAVWGLGDLGAAFAGKRPSLAELFDEDMLGDDLDAWMAESYLLKRMFRNCALIAGLIEKRHPGKEKTGRQVTMSSDLIYDILRSHEPDHILMQATWADASSGLLDIARLGDMLARIKGRIIHQPARPHITAGGAGDAGNRQGSGRWRRRGARLARGGRRSRQGGHGRWLRRLPSAGRAPSRRWSVSSASSSRRSAKASYGGPMSACWRSPIFIWRRVRPSPAAASLCLPTTPARPCSVWPASSNDCVHAPSWPWVTASTTMAVLSVCPPATVFHLPPSRLNGSGSGSPATTTPVVRLVWTGEPMVELSIGRITFRHEPGQASPDGEVAGHLHPSARVFGRGKSVRRRCFVGDGHRLILPAFGAYTGGLDIRDQAFAGLFDGAGLRAFMLGDGQVYPVGRRALGLRG